MSNKKIHGLLISSGLSRRMGKPKALLDWDGVPFITGISLKMLTVCDELLVVVGHESTMIKATLISTIKKAERLPEPYRQIAGEPGTLDRIRFFFNDQFLEGMFTSLRNGLWHIHECDWVLYHFVDQPALPFTFYKEFTGGPLGGNWVQPTWQGKSGHPILIGSELFNEIRNSPAMATLRDISRQPFVKKEFKELPWPAITEDIDTPEAYNELLQRKGKTT